jgi:alpha-1,6-mannosyltransferase
MKTLHLTNAYHPTSGGIRTFYCALLRSADEQGREMVLVVPGERSQVEAVGRRGRIYTIGAPHALAFDRRYRLLLPHRYLPPIRGELVRVLERERPDLVEISDKYSLPYLAAILRKGGHHRVGRPALVGLSCERFDDNMRAYVSPSAAARAFTRWYIRNIYGPPFDCHIANSEYTAEELRSALYDRAPDFIRVCPMGVDEERFGPEHRSNEVRRHLLSEAGGAPTSVLLLYAGRLSPEKNLGLLIETLRELTRDTNRDYRLIVAGDGPQATWLREQSTGSLAGRIVQCGTVNRETLATYCASCDVFVHPNPREPFGIGPLEAMASGVPVVLPAVGGVLQFANPRNAWLAAPLAAAFADAVRAAASAEPSRLRAARATARLFRWSRVSQRFFATYDDIHQSITARLKRDSRVLPVGAGPSASAAKRLGETSPKREERRRAGRPEGGCEGPPLRSQHWNPQTGTRHVTHPDCEA